MIPLNTFFSLYNFSNILYIIITFSRALSIAVAIFTLQTNVFYSARMIFCRF